MLTSCPPHLPTPTCCVQNFLEQLVTLGLGTVQQENLFLFRKDIVRIHLPSQRSDCRQHFQVKQLIPKVIQPPLSRGKPWGRGACGKSATGEHLPDKSSLLVLFLVHPPCGTWERMECPRMEPHRILAACWGPGVGSGVLNSEEDKPSLNSFKFQGPPGTTAVTIFHPGPSIQ